MVYDSLLHLMRDTADILDLVRASAVRKVLYLSHAVRQMTRPDRVISPEDVRYAIDHGVVIEDYPEDVRGHSCLIVAHLESGRTIHVCYAPKDGFLAIITAYVPSPDQWTENFTRRSAP